LPRKARQLSESKVYHIILRGIDKQDIFYDNEDKIVFKNQLLTIKNKFKIKIFAYCLMNNHVHLVIESQDEKFSKSIQSLGIRYSQYFNKKYSRSGVFFEERFKSKEVLDERYFMNVCRYVHRNPENAGFEKTAKYKWSSYNEYVNEEKIIDKKTLLYYFQNNIENFIEFTLKDDYTSQQDEMNDFLEYEIKMRLSDEQVTKIILEKLNLKSINEIAEIKSKKQRDKNIEKIGYIKGTNINQLARIIGISRGIIERILKNE
jgi:REP element-mobilizing transposase RayT